MRGLREFGVRFVVTTFGFNAIHSETTGHVASPVKGQTNFESTDCFIVRSSRRARISSALCLFFSILISRNRLTCYNQINQDGAAARDKRLKVGQRILEVNNQSLLGCTHAEAVRTLRSMGEQASVLLCHGYDPNEDSVCGLQASHPAALARQQAEEVSVAGKIASMRVFVCSSCAAATCGLGRGWFVLHTVFFRTCAEHAAVLPRAILMAIWGNVLC